MKKLFYILLFTVLVLTFMDGRKSRRDSLKEAVEEFSTRQNGFKSLSITPKLYTEIKTDSVVNAFKASIKNYSLMDSQDLLKSKTKKNYHRKFESSISVSYQDKPILETVLNADTFEMKEDLPFWRNATLEHAWVDLDNCSESKLVINISFLDPETEFFKLYQLKIDSNGKKEFILVEEKLV